MCHRVPLLFENAGFTAPAARSTGCSGLEGAADGQRWTVEPLTGAKSTKSMGELHRQAGAEAV